MRKIILVGFLMVLMVACQKEQTNEAVEPTDIGTILTNYQEWHRVTVEPRAVSLFLWTMCRAPYAEEEAYLETEHANRVIQVYVNDIGLAAMQAGTTFPMGSIIVKEKSLEQGEAHAWGIMIKHEAGFNPTGGDWEYLYRERVGDSLQGPKTLAHCQACHIAPQPEGSIFAGKHVDSVFRGYIEGQ